jgi:hypothetical protein
MSRGGNFLGGVVGREAGDNVLEGDPQQAWVNDGVSGSSSRRLGTVTETPFGAGVTAAGYGILRLRDCFAFAKQSVRMTKLR